MRPISRTLQRLNPPFYPWRQTWDHLEALRGWMKPLPAAAVTELQQVDADDPDKLHFFRFVNQGAAQWVPPDILENTGRSTK